MSRIGKKVRQIPSGVSVAVEGNAVRVKGPKGELTLSLHPRVTVIVNGNEVSVQVADPEAKRDRALWGTFSSLINNLLKGVTEGFETRLEINGVGYKAALKGNNLELQVGYSHPVLLSPLPGVSFAVEKNIIIVAGPDKQQVGAMAAAIRAVRKPEPYKGKGIKYATEIIRRKAGKTAAKAAA